MLIDEVVLIAGFFLLEFGGVFDVFLSLVQEVVGLGSYEVFVAEGVQHSGLTLFVGRF